MNVVLGHDEVVASWVGQINGKVFVQPFTAIGLVDGAGKLRGGFVFTGFNGDGVEMSLAGAACLTRSGLAVVANYVFEQLKCVRLQLHSRRSNKRVLRMVGEKRPSGRPGLGFKFEGISRRFYGSEDGIRYAITIDDIPAFRARWRL